MLRAQEREDIEVGYIWPGLAKPDQNHLTQSLGKRNKSLLSFVLPVMHSSRGHCEKGAGVNAQSLGKDLSDLPSLLCSFPKSRKMEATLCLCAYVCMCVRECTYTHTRDGKEWDQVVTALGPMAPGLSRIRTSLEMPMSALNLCWFPPGLQTPLRHL